MNKELNYNFAERLVICALASLLGAAVIVVALLVCAALMMYFDLGEELASPLSGICMGIGALAAGFVATRKIRTGGIVSGGMCGIMIFLVVFIISVIIAPSVPSLICLYHGLIALLSSAVGGILGVNNQPKRKII